MRLMNLWIEQKEQIATHLTQLCCLLRLGYMGALWDPIPHRGQSPALPVVGHPANQNTKQFQVLITILVLEAKLQQQAAALQARTPAREMKREVERFRFIPQAGLGVIPPRPQVRLCSRELFTHQGDNGGHCPHLRNALH